MNQINTKTIAFGIAVLCALFTVRLNTPLRAKAPTLSPQARAESQNTIEEWFNDPSNLSASGCDQTTWNVMHEAIRAAAQKRELPPSSIADDTANAEQIDKCAEKADQQRTQLIQILGQLNRDNMKEITALGEARYSHPDAAAGAKAILNIETNTGKHTMFLDWYMTQESVLTFADEASHMYMNHADETRYRNLVERYNTLANSLTNVRLAQGSNFPIQPHTLHCESSTNPVTHTTQLDCQ